MEVEDEDDNNFRIDYGHSDSDLSLEGDNPEKDDVIDDNNEEDDRKPMSLVRTDENSNASTVSVDETNEAEIKVLQQQVRDLQDREKKRNDLLAKAAYLKQREDLVRRVEAAKIKVAQNQKDPPPKQHEVTQKKRMNEMETDNKKKKQATATGTEEEVTNLIKPVKTDYTNWEIKADKNRETEEYTPPDHIEDEYDSMISVNNHRKELGKQGQILITWKFGCRWWSDIQGAHKDKPALVELYMTRYNLTEKLMGFKMNPKHKKKTASIDASIDQEEIVLLQKCEMLHDDWLNYQPEGNKAYCKEGYHFFGVKCANQQCNKAFVFDATINGKLHMGIRNNYHIDFILTHFITLLLQKRQNFVLL